MRRRPGVAAARATAGSAHRTAAHSAAPVQDLPLHAGTGSLNGPRAHLRLPLHLHRPRLPPIHRQIYQSPRIQNIPQNTHRNTHLHRPVRPPAAMHATKPHSGHPRRDLWSHRRDLRGHQLLCLDLRQLLGRVNQCHEFPDAAMWARRDTVAVPHRLHRPYVRYRPCRRDVIGRVELQLP